MNITDIDDKIIREANS
jgi:cysteinyl-tRNA synthetase